MARWLVRFGYDGSSFGGWARQPGRETVEGTLRRGLVRCGVASSAEAASLEVASRTDRAVSARANALVVRSDLGGPRLLRALNGIAPQVFFTGATEVEDTFRPRRALERWYRYFEPRAGRNPETWRRVAAGLGGRIDVRSLGRGLATPEPVWRDLGSVGVSEADDRLVVDVRAPSFVWGMVRKLIAAMREIDRGTLEGTALEAALRGRRRLTLPLAEPEPLVLWEVRYAVPWRHLWDGPNRYQRRHFAREAENARGRLAVLGALDPSGPRET